MDKQALSAALNEYEKVRDSARAEYRKVWDSARDEYRKATGPALTEYDKVRDSAWDEYRKVWDSAWDEYRKVRDSARAEYEKVRDSAWARVSESVSDPLVSWIVENTSNYRNEALLVLRSLPASLSELDALAVGKGWCDVWREFRSDALDAGVIEA